MLHYPEHSLGTRYSRQRQPRARPVQARQRAHRSNVVHSLTKISLGKPPVYCGNFLRRRENTKYRTQSDRLKVYLRQTAHLLEIIAGDMGRQRTFKAAHYKSYILSKLGRANARKSNPELVTIK